MKKETCAVCSKEFEYPHWDYTDEMLIDEIKKKRPDDERAYGPFLPMYKNIIKSEKINHPTCEAIALQDCLNGISHMAVSEIISKGASDDFPTKTFENFRTTRENQPKINAIEPWTEEEEFGFLVYGPTGCGKTHLMYAVVNKIIQRIINSEETKAIAFKNRLSNNLSYGDLFPKLPTMINATNFLNRIKRDDFKIPQCAFKHSLFILDDLGAENVTDWSREIMLQVFEYRTNKKLPTMVTTNFTMNELREKMGERITSRILGLCFPLGLTGADYRIERMKAFAEKILNRAKMSQNNA